MIIESRSLFARLIASRAAVVFLSYVVLVSLGRIARDRLLIDLPILPFVVGAFSLSCLLAVALEAKLSIRRRGALENSAVACVLGAFAVEAAYAIVIAYQNARSAMPTDMMPPRAFGAFLLFGQALYSLINLAVGFYIFKTVDE